MWTNYFKSTQLCKFQMLTFILKKKLKKSIWEDWNSTCRINKREARTQTIEKKFSWGKSNTKSRCYKTFWVHICLDCKIFTRSFIDICSVTAQLTLLLNFSFMVVQARARNFLFNTFISSLVRNINIDIF